MHLFVQLLDELKPVIQTDLEDLSVLDLGNSDKVEMTMREKVSVWEVLDKLNLISVYNSSHTRHK